MANNTAARVLEFGRRKRKAVAAGAAAAVLAGAAAGGFMAFHQDGSSSACLASARAWDRGPGGQALRKVSSGGSTLAQDYSAVQADVASGSSQAPVDWFTLYSGALLWQEGVARAAKLPPPACTGASPYYAKAMSDWNRSAAFALEAGSKESEAPMSQASAWLNRGAAELSRWSASRTRKSPPVP